MRIVVIIALLLIFNKLQAQDNLAHYNLTELDNLYQQKTKEKKFEEALPIALAMLEKGKKELNPQDTSYAQILYKLADLYEYLGDSDKAISHLENAIAIQKVKIPLHTDYANSLHLLGILYKNIGDYAQAESFYTQALNIRKKVLGEKHPRYASSLGNLGELYYYMGDYSKAESFHLQALNIRKEVLGEKHPDYAASLNNLGFLYDYIGDYTQAESFYLKALKICKEVSGEKSSDYAVSLGNLGGLYNSMGDYNKAESFYLETSNILKEVLGEKNRDYASSLDNLGSLYNNRGDYTKAERFYLQALNIRKEVLGEKHPEYAASLNNISNLYKRLGDYAKAESFLLQALEIKREVLGEKHPDYASSLSNIGNLYYSLGDYAKAENFYLQTLSIEKEILGENHPSYANTLNSLGILYHDLKDYPKAENFYLRALAIQKEVLGEKHLDYAKHLNSLAGLYKDQVDYDKAESFYLAALKIREAILGEMHPDCATNLSNLGTLYQDRHNYEKAISCYLKALNILKEILGEKHPDYSTALNNIGILYKETNDLKSAWLQALAAIQSNTDLALSAAISKNWVDSLAEANYVSLENMNKSLTLIYDLLASENQPTTKEKQILICDIAMKLLERSKNELSTEEDKLRILAQSSIWVLKSIKILDKEKDIDKALSIAEQNKSVLLLDAASNRRAYSFGILPDSLVQREKTLQSRYTNAKAALSEKRSPEESELIRSELTVLNLEIDAFKKSIKKDYPKYAALKYEHGTVPVADVQATLDEKTALLEYVIGDSVVYIFWLDKKRTLLKESMIDYKDLLWHIKTLHANLSDYSLINQNPEVARQDYIIHATWLYEMLVKPILQDVQGIERLIIIPDKELAHLPFETFLVETPSDGEPYSGFHYLMKDYSISYNYSATLWKENTAHQNKNNGQLFAMAAHYTSETGLDEIRLPTYQRMREELNPLPAARLEVESLEKKYSGFFGFDYSASEKVFKEKAGDYAILHLAMHGLLNKREPILSSLAFSEDRDSLENNFLQAYEISKMELNADLVVLSACETGYGKFEAGNGTASLARAFMHAGIPAMVVSLWQVNDMSTASLMDFFYKNLADKLPKDQALQLAKLNYIQSAQGVAGHPAYWSPFIMMGNTSVIHISPKGSGQWIWWLAGGGGLLVLIIGGLLVRKRTLQ